MADVDRLAGMLTLDLFPPGIGDEVERVLGVGDEPVPVDTRRRLIRAARRGTQYRLDRIATFRVVLFQLMTAAHPWRPPEWADMFPPVPRWVGPYDLGDE